MKWKQQLAWNMRGAVMRHVWSEFTSTANRPPPLDDGIRLWAPYMARRGRLVWVDMRGERFESSFARETFRSRIMRSSADVRITRIEALETVDEVANGISPSGFVFHVSRCGSTLLRNMLGAVRRGLSIGEPAFVTPALSSESPGAVQRRIHGGIKALGRAYTGQEKHFFIKFSSPHVGRLDVFEACFPDVPMLYLYRDPTEVFQKVIYGGGCGWLAMKSNPRRAARFVGLDPVLIEEMSPDEYAARVIGRHYEIAAEHSTHGLALLNYRNLTEPDCIRKVLEFFGLDVTDDEFDKVVAITKKNAKCSNKGLFIERRIDELSTAQRSLVERWAVEPYEALERLGRALSTGTP